jgi:membrane protease YdiL (CAAX protease family)
MSGAIGSLFDMKRLNDLIAVTCFSVAALLVFQLPDFIPDDNLNSAFKYGLLALAFFYFTWSYRLPSLAYFRMPEISLPSFVAILVAAFYAQSAIFSERAISLPLWPTITGIVYIFAIGAGEELVTRGFAFGVLKKYGTVFAVIVSSVIFGLMHINVYLGEYWDPVSAYWHCVSAAGFGALAAVIMIASRSIVVPIVMHALFDWTVVFSKSEVEESSDYINKFDPLWQTFKDSLAEISMELFFIALILCFMGFSRRKRKWRIPRLFRSALLKLGLVEESSSAAS